MPTNGIYKVLIVEDSVAIARVVQQSMGKRPQFLTLVAYDAEEGISLAEIEKPDIVMMDINLPRMNGLEACRRLKDMFPAMPVIVMTGEIDPALRLKAYEAGADDFLAKPFTTDQAVSHVRYHLHLSSLDHSV